MSWNKFGHEDAEMTRFQAIFHNLKQFKEFLTN
jgi:hypothetical protein